VIVRRLLLPFVLVLALAGALAAPAAVAAPATTSDLSTVAITGEVGTKPTVTIASPIAVKTTKATTLVKGTGEKLVKGANVTLDFVFVNGRTGDELETSYGTNSVTIPLDKAQTQATVVDNLTGKHVGDRVVIAIAPKEGFAESAAKSNTTIKKSDTLLFVADVHGTKEALKRAEGEAVAPVDGQPAVKVAKNGAPTISVPKTDPPTTLIVQPLIKGTGPVVATGQTITVHYTGVVWRNGKIFDSSWKRGTPATFSIGTAAVIAGWDEGLVGQTVGSQVLLVIPPDKGYGADGNSGAGIKGTDTLVFVVDILDAT
jgi:peptidylprolyl isomerase